MHNHHQQQTVPAKEAMIYRRVSTDTAEQNNESLEQQETDCRNYSEENGLTVVEVFREAEGGEPGTSPAKNKEEK